MMRAMRNTKPTGIWRVLGLLVSLIVVACMCVACGKDAAGTASSHAPQSSATPTSFSSPVVSETPQVSPTSTTSVAISSPTPGTTSGGTGKATTSQQGCPTTQQPASDLALATVVVEPKDVEQTVTAHIGDAIEVRAPLGFKWIGPTSSQGGLQLAQPSGYVSSTYNACIWHYTAQSTGSIDLHFQRMVLCRPNAMCPYVVVAMSITIDVK
ncbi:hypothetical protein [Tengunoibacter tsumagoiensis]|uniref:Uncharacterized protein n=1 Tax=Tengunoibacter tsumagoiensis TaxID=2014871 RepID=A0A401ZTS9_9CHLR|nr:hypothetical protein [Tengunoibacter tsumagoiensis]GCE10180.1 hypothetical protein KTT_00390 [Tengunoibacter tsumagoiensis]